MAKIIKYALSLLATWNVELVKGKADPFEVLHVLHAVDEVAAHDLGDVGEGVVGAVHDAA